MCRVLRSATRQKVEHKKGRKCVIKMLLVAFMVTSPWRANWSVDLSIVREATKLAQISHLVIRGLKLGRVINGDLLCSFRNSFFRFPRKSLGFAAEVFGDVFIFNKDDILGGTIRYGERPKFSQMDATLRWPEPTDMPKFGTKVKWWPAHNDLSLRCLTW